MIARATQTNIAYTSFLDLLHTIMIVVANYSYFVSNFGDMNVTDRAFWWVFYDVMSRTALISIDAL